MICFTSAARNRGYDVDTAFPRVLNWKSQMATIARVLARAFPKASFDAEVLKLLALLCGAGLLLSLLMMIYGLDLGAAFF